MAPSFSMKQFLPSSEWGLVASLILIMASLVVVAQVKSCRAAAILQEQKISQEELAPSTITVFIQGAVIDPRKMTLPATSRICDLKSKIECTAEADKAFFRRRKRLKEGDVIEVPKKKG